MKIKEIIIRYRDIFYYIALSNSLKDCKTVLDVGCGNNSPLANVKKTFVSHGIDIFGPDVKISKSSKIHNSYTNGDIRKLNTYFKPKSFDAVIALDVVEHLQKKDSLTLIKRMENIARKKVIILTPNVFYRQKPIQGNPYQEHLSAWNIKDFVKLGYIVKGLRGFKYLRKEFATIHLKPWLFWAVIVLLSEPILWHFPNVSYHLYAVKNLQDE